MKIGFIGLGAMGHAMAQRLAAAGHELMLFNRTSGKADDLVAKGAVLAGSPAEVARDVDIVFSMLFDDAATEEACFGAQGLASTLPAGAIHVCCSTLSLAQARRLRDGHAERGQIYVTATVLGRPPAAQAGELFIIAGGDDATLTRLEPLFLCLGQRIFRAGDDPVQANLVKLSMNFMIFSTIEQMSEVFALNEKAGIDPATVFEIMTGTLYNAPVHRNYGKLMIERRYDPPGAPLTLGLKDVSLFMQAGDEFHVPLPYASVVRDRMFSGINAGDAQRDFTVLFEQARKDAGLA